jgi:hypothetical protein
MKTTLRQLHLTLLHHTCEFARGAQRHPALAYPAPADLLFALAARSRLTSDQRNAITQALVAEVQRSPHPLWSSLLLVAFEPAMKRIRKQVRRVVEDASELVMLAFLEAAKTVKPSSAAMVMAFHRAAVRKVRQKLPKKQAPIDEVTLHPGTPDVAWPHDPSPFVLCAAQEVLRECAKVPGGTQMARARAGVPPADADVEADAQAETTDPGERRRQRWRNHSRNQRVLHRVRSALRAEPGRRG